MRNKHLSKIILLGLVATLLACNTENKNEDELSSGVVKANMDTLVKPGDDFAAYVNGTWIKNNQIPADKGSYGAGYMVHEQAENDVKKIIEESAKGDFEVGSPEQKVGDLYSSFMDIEKRNELGYEPLNADLHKIDSISSYDDLAAYFAYAAKIGVTNPLQQVILTDFKDPNTYAFYLFQSGLGLPEREYYLSKDAKSKEIREKYVDLIAKEFDLVGLPDGKKDAGLIMDLETQIAQQHMKKEDTRDIVKLYNPFPVDSLDAVMPNFNWDIYLKDLGVSNLDKIIIGTVDYAKALDKIITSTNLDTWKTYLKWGLINSNADKLTEALDKQNFEFFQKELQGVEEPRPMWTRGVGAVNGDLGEVVGEVYVKEHFPPEAKKRMRELVNNLIDAYEASIKELDWMSEDTKKEALDKLHNFTPKIGYPDKWKDYSSLEIKEDDYYGNAQRSSQFAFQKQIDKLGGPIDKTEWTMNPQTVNAYYNPMMNEIVFPAGILQPPFFDMHADDAVNYGGIGAVIGHEIGHGFDDQGSTFDGTGTMRNWWTDNDRDEFKKRTQALVNQYSKFEVLDSVYVNGAYTLGENIGDLGGLSIALKAYKISLDGKEPPVLDGFTGEQRVFLGWAQVWLNKARDESLRMQISTDPHSPALFRINGVVRNIPEFYEAFDVQPGDSLYLAPENRVKIW